MRFRLRQRLGLRRGLLCADEYKTELAAIGLDPRKADCGNVGQWNEEVCFDESLLGGFTGLGNCQFDCDRDSDCGDGFLCADDHTPELEARGFDKRKAACGPVGHPTEEVCFDEGLLDREVCEKVLCQPDILGGLIVGPAPNPSQPTLAACFDFCFSDDAVYVALNLNFNPEDPESGPPFIPGTPNFDEVVVSFIEQPGATSPDGTPLPPTLCLCSTVCTGLGETLEPDFIGTTITAKGNACADFP